MSFKFLRYWLASRWAVSAVLMVALANCSGQSCTGCDYLDPIPGGFPSDKRIQNGIQVRLSSNGIEFIEQNAADIVEDMMPGGLTFEIPPICDQEINVVITVTIDICGQGSSGSCNPDSPPCQIQAEIVGMDLTPQTPSTMAVELRINAWSVNSLHTHQDINCTIDLDTRSGSQSYARALASVDLVQDPTSMRTRLVLGSVEIPDGDIENADISISGGWQCTAIDWFFKGMIIDEIRDAVAGQVAPMMNSLCMTCEPANPLCPQMSSCQTVNVDGEDHNWCMEESGQGCVQTMGTEGRMDLGSMMAAISAGIESYLDLHVWAGGGSSAVEAGMTVGVLAGVVGTPEHSECVPPRDAPAVTPVPTSTVFMGNERPDGQPFHVGVGVHKSVLDAAGYAIYDTGALCLSVGPKESEYLTMGTFKVLLDSLGDLAHDTNPPMVLAIRPQNPLTFELGAGTVDEEGNVLEPLIIVRSEDFSIDFFALVDYRFIRLFRLKADLALPLVLVANGQNQLQPVLGDLGEAFQNIRVESHELLAETEDQIAGVFPILLDIAGGYLGEGIPPFDLPDLQGFRLVLDEGSITGADNNTFLGIFANLEYTGLTPIPPGLQRARTEVALVDLDLPATEEFRVRGVEDTLHAGPKVTVALGGSSPDGGRLEWSYRLDGGFWSPYTRSSLLTVQRPALWLQGRHRMDVRARVQGRPETTDLVGDSLEILVDTIPPELVLTAAGNHVLLHGQDMVSPEERLSYSYRVNGGAWSEWSNISSIRLSDGSRSRLDVRVKDEAGNESTASIDHKVVGLYPKVPSPEPGDCGCRANRSSKQTSGVLFLLMAAFLGLMLRRRRSADGRSDERIESKKGGSAPFDQKPRGGAGAALLLVVAGLWGLGLGMECKGKKSGGGETQCLDASPIPLVCQEPVPTCESWEELAPLEDPTLDPETCEPIPVPCECRTAVAIEPGDHGRFLGLAARDGQVLVSCYSDRWGDLNVVSLGQGGELIPEAVDGVPLGAPSVADPEGFRHGIDRRGDNVGKFTSIAIGSDAQARVSYKDEEEGTLKYAQGTVGDWTLHQVADPGSETEQVYYTKILLDAGDVPHIFYAVNGVADATNMGQFMGQLRLAQATSSTPTSSADWTVTVVDETVMSCAGYCASGEVCVASDLTCHAEETTCGSCGTGTGCVGGSCVTTLSEITYTDHPEGTGMFVNAAFLSDGRIALAYYDRVTTVVRLALGQPGNFTTQTVDGTIQVDVGLAISMAVGADDGIHLAYHDASNDALVYTSLDGTGKFQETEVVDDGIRDDGHHVVGTDTHIFFDNAGVLRIFYQDGDTVDLLEAARNGPGDWTISDLMVGDPGYGFFVKVARDTNGTLYAAQYVYDRAAEVFGSLHVWELSY